MVAILLGRGGRSNSYCREAQGTCAPQAHSSITAIFVCRSMMAAGAARRVVEGGGTHSTHRANGILWSRQSSRKNGVQATRGCSAAAQGW